MNKVSSFIQ